MTAIEFAICREAHKIRTVPGYSPEGATITLVWADAIAEREGLKGLFARDKERMSKESLSDPPTIP